MSFRSKSWFALKWTFIMFLGLFAHVLHATTIHLESDRLLMGVTASIDSVAPPILNDEFYLGQIFNRSESVLASASHFNGEFREVRGGFVHAKTFEVTGEGGFSADIGTNHSCDECQEFSGAATAFFDLEWIFSVDGDGASIRVEVIFGRFNDLWTSSFVLYDITDDEFDANLFEDNPTGIFDLEDGHQYVLFADGSVSSNDRFRNIDPDPYSIVFQNVERFEVPEPGALALLGIGFAGLGLRERFRKV